MAEVEPAPWENLVPGTRVTIIKIAPGGEEVTRYPGEITRHDAHTGWVTARAIWTNREVDIDGVRFRPNDAIDEYFSATEWFNAFQVWHGDAGAQGWYINVTYPTRLTRAGDELILLWHDLYLDVVIRPDGVVIVRDEDELAASALATRDPALHARILGTREHILNHVAHQTGPFGPGDRTA